jgi:hypothetical protein
MDLFSRGPAATIRTGYNKTDRHLDQVFDELGAAAHLGQGSYAISIGWQQAAGRYTPAQTMRLYIDHLQRAGYAIQSATAPPTNTGYATIIVDLRGSVIRSTPEDSPTLNGVPLPIKMIAAFENGRLYAVHEDGVWKSRIIFSDETPDSDLRGYHSYRTLCVSEGREFAAMQGSLGIIPDEMQEDFAASFRASL